MPGRPIKRVVYAALFPVFCVVGLEIAVTVGLMPPSLAAAPSAIFERLIELSFDGEILLHAAYSISRITVAVLLALLTGVAAAIFLTRNPFLDKLFTPTLKFISPIPVVAWMPFLVLLVGIGEPFKIALPAFASFLLIQLHAYQGIKNIDHDLLELSVISRFSPLETIRKVLIPGAAVDIFTGLRLSLAISWIVMFFVEYSSAKAGSQGLGWFIADARALGRLEDEYAGVLLLGTVGFLSDKIVLTIKEKILPWNQEN